MPTDLLQSDIAVLAAILTIGTFIGKLKLGNVAVSASGGVLLIALIFGHWGFDLPDGLSTFGFAFFMYSIGFGAGPRFFQSFKKNGLKYVIIALFVAVVSCAVAIPLAIVFELPSIMLPGILGGALTSTSTLAAAYEIAKDPAISVAYGITYPFGLMGLLLFIQFLTKSLHIDLKKEAEKFKVEDVDDDDDEEEKETFQKRVYQVQNVGAVAKSLQELDLRRLSGVGIVSIRRGQKTFLATAESKLELHDHVMAEGPLDNLLQLEEYIGPEVVDQDIVEQKSVTAKVIVTAKTAINKTIADLRLPQDFGVLLTRFRRGAVELPISPDIALERGDVLTVTGEKDRLDHAIVMLGHRDNKRYETDIFIFCFGILFGVLLGRIELPLINTSIGNAGGLLFSGILIGYFRHYGYYSGRMPLAARYILQELGMLFFLATVGVRAGHGLVEQLAQSGLEIFITGAAVTIITLVATVFFCRYIIKFDWNTSFGATTGGITSTVALKMITEKADSQYALLGYAGVYAFANILLTLLGQLLLYLPRF
jgi:putative transport protein